MSNKSGTSAHIISPSRAVGPLHEIGEAFTPDLFTGTRNFTLIGCGKEKVMKVEKYEGSCVGCDGIESRDCYAWLDLMPSRS
jgi:hypothetical protein